jgi:hypothetical protein
VTGCVRALNDFERGRREVEIDDLADCRDPIPDFFSVPDPGSGAEVVKPSTISTAQLHPSPDFHMRPIEQVVYLRSYPVKPVGNLISRRASHLDAFSAYPCRT